MKKILKIFLVLILIIIVCIASLLTYVKIALPNVGAAPEL